MIKNTWEIVKNLGDLKIMISKYLVSKKIRKLTNGCLSGHTSRCKSSST